MLVRAYDDEEEGEGRVHVSKVAIEVKLVRQSSCGERRRASKK